MRDRKEDDSPNGTRKASPVAGPGQYGGLCPPRYEEPRVDGYHPPIEPYSYPDASWYRSLVESQPDLICGFLPDTTLTYVNAAYARFFGSRAEDLIGRRFIDFLSPDDQARIRLKLSEFAPESPECQYEHPTRRADGELCWHLWHDFALFDESGHPCEFQSIGVDVTERKRAENALRQATEELAAVFQAMPDLFFRMGGGWDLPGLSCRS